MVSSTLTVIYHLILYLLSNPFNFTIILLDPCRLPRYRWDQLLVLAWRAFLPLVLVGVFFVTAIFVSNLTFFQDPSHISQMLNLAIFIPLNIRILLQKYADFRQNLYNKITIKLFEIPVITTIIKFWHKLLFSFRIYSIQIGNQIEKYISLNMLMLIISVIMSKFHIAGYLIIFCLSFFRLDFSVLSMLRFYKKYPEKLSKLYHPQEREMWTQAVKIAQEAASNPQVQTVAVGVIGALAWKTLDVYDVYTQKEISEQELKIQKEIAEQDRIAENQRHSEEMIMRRAELNETQAARVDENRRHAEEMAMRQIELEQNLTKKD